MGIFTGYYESSKNALECARECLHTRGLKTSPVSLFRVEKYYPVCYRSLTLQKFESVMYRIKNSINSTGLLFVPSPEADLN